MGREEAERHSSESRASKDASLRAWAVGSVLIIFSPNGGSNWVSPPLPVSVGP